MKLESLEGVRGFAAVYVLLHHLNPLAGTPFEPILKFGQEAVILFFLVSGFVIAYSQIGARAKRSPLGFLEHRAIRIYPIFLISMVLAAFAAAVSGRSECISTKAVIGNLLMLQDIAFLKSGTWVEPFCSNSPLWSLSYEWWFYVAFAVLFASDRLSMKARRIGVAAASLFGTVLFLLHPSQPLLFASYFSLWWAGLELSLEFVHRKKTSFRAQRFPIFLLVACAAIWAIPVVQALVSGGPLSLGREPVLQLRHFLAGIVFMLLAIIGSRIDIVPKKVIRLCSLAAPVSYGLYASHQLVIQLVQQLNLNWYVNLVTTVALAFAVAYILEIVIQPRIARWLSKPKITLNT